MTEVFLILIMMAVLWIVALVMLALVWVYGMKKDRRKQNDKGRKTESGIRHFK